MLNCRWELDWESIVSRKFLKKCIRHGSATRFKVKIFYCCSSAIKRESGELCSTHCLSFIYYYVVIVLPATNFNRNHNQFHFIPRKISSYMAYICILFFYSNTITSIYTWIIKKSSFGLLPYTRNCSLAIQIDFTSYSSFPGLNHQVAIILWSKVSIGVEQSGKWNKNESQNSPQLHFEYKITALYSSSFSVIFYSRVDIRCLTFHLWKFINWPLLIQLSIVIYSHSMYYDCGMPHI